MTRIPRCQNQRICTKRRFVILLIIKRSTWKVFLFFWVFFPHGDTGELQESVELRGRKFKMI